MGTLMPARMHDTSMTEYLFVQWFDDNQIDTFKYEQQFIYDQEDALEFIKQFHWEDNCVYYWRELLQEMDDEAQAIHRMTDEQVEARLAELLSDGQLKAYHLTKEKNDGDDAEYAEEVSGSEASKVSSTDKRAIRKPEAKKESKQKAAAVSPATKKCNIDDITISCSHSERSYKLNINKDKPTKDGKYVYQVLAATNSPDKIKVTFSGGCGFGNAGKNSQSTKADKKNRPNAEKNCPYVSITGPNCNVQQPSPVDVEVVGPNVIQPSESISDFLKKILVPESNRPQSYNLEGKLCSTTPGHKAVIEAYTPVNWSGKVGVKYFHDAHKDSNFNQNQGFKYLKVDSLWELYGGISVSYDRFKWEIGGKGGGKAGRKDSSAASNMLFEGAQKFLNKVTPLLGNLESNLGKVTINWPSLELSGKYELKEDPYSYKVLPDNEVKFGFNPLIGAKVETDILNWVLALVGTTGSPALSKFLLTAKEKAEKGLGGKDFGGKGVFSIMLGIKGDILGNLTWNKYGDANWNVAGALEGNIEIFVAGKVHVEARVFFVKVGGGATFDAKTGVGGKIEATSNTDCPAIYGQLLFSGLVIEWALYYEIGGTENQSSERGVPQDPGVQEYNDSATNKGGKGNRLVLAEPAKWPEYGKAKIELKSGSV